MELSKKTTILFDPGQYDRLARLARQRGVSLGHLVREACERQYGLSGSAGRTEAVRALAMLSLPVDSAARMKRESVPDPEGLLP